MRSLFLVCAFAATLFGAAPILPTIAVLPLKNGSEVTSGEAEIISDRLRVELFKTGLVDILEREQMQSVLKEQGFQASGACSDEGCLVEMGQILGVRYMITGSIGRLGNMYLINIRSIDIKTAKIDRVVSLDISGDISSVVRRIPDIAFDLTAPSGSVKRTTSEPPPRKDEDDEDKQEDAAEPEPVTLPPPVLSEVNCYDNILLQLPIIEAPLGFQPDRQLVEEITDEITDAIESGIEESTDEDVDIETVTAEQIKAIPADCRTGLVKSILTAYTARPDGSETRGTATVTFTFFASARDAVPLYKLTIKEEGDSGEDNKEALSNAFDEVLGTLEEKLGDWEPAEKLLPKKR